MIDIEKQVDYWRSGAREDWTVATEPVDSGRVRHGLLVVAPDFDGTRNRRDVDLLWHLAARVDNRIEPVPCGVQQWHDDRVNPIVEIARREGVAVVV